MRTRLLFIPLAVVTALALVAAACGGNSDSGDLERAGDKGPQSLGLVAPDTFLTFDGQRYRLQDTLQAGLIDDEFTDIGVATDADIDFEGELLVFRREGDDDAVYTFSPAVQEEEVPDLGLPGGEATDGLRMDEDKPGSVTAEEPLDEATDAGEGPVVGTGSGSASGDDGASDSDQGRTIVHERPDEEPPEEEPTDDAIVDSVEVVDAEEGVPSGLWLRWEIE
jgi:hypothetical protein